MFLRNDLRFALKVLGFKGTLKALFTSPEPFTDLDVLDEETRFGKSTEWIRFSEGFPLSEEVRKYLLINNHKKTYREYNTSMNKVPQRKTHKTMSGEEILKKAFKIVEPKSALEQFSNLIKPSK